MLFETKKIKCAFGKFLKVVFFWKDVFSFVKEKPRMRKQQGGPLQKSAEARFMLMLEVVQISQIAH